MSEGDHGLVAFAILVFATLLVIAAAVIALLRSRRVPGLPATSTRAVEEVAACMRMDRLVAMLQRADPLGRSVTSRPVATGPLAMLPGRPKLA